MEKLYIIKLKTILQSRYLFKVLALIFIIYALSITNLIKYKSIYKDNVININMVLDKYTINDDKVTLYLKGKEDLIGKYYLNKDNKIDNIKLGSTINIKGTLTEVSNNTVPNIFNYKKYLYNKHIYYIVKIDNIKVIKNNTSIIYFIRNLIINRIDKFDRTGYIKTFIIGDKSGLDDEVLSNYQRNGVSHLFSISGMHISLIAGIILYILKKLSYNYYFIYSQVILFLLFYLLLVGVQASILRAVIMYIVISINKCYNLHIKNIDIMFIVLIIVIIIDPFFIYNTGFQFSYLISFTLVLLSKKINSINTYIRKSLYISYISFLISLPICIYNYYQVNILSIILNIFLVPMVSIIVFPLSILTFIFPFLYKVLYLFIYILELVNKIVGNINIFVLPLSKISILVVIIYYLIIYLSLYDKKYLYVLIIFIIIHKNINYLSNESLVLSLDVNQGDSIIIKLPYSNKVSLIDTGGIVSYNKNNYSIVETRTIPYLKSIGINKIENLIISHGDYDHMGEAINLVNNFKVEKVIFNCGPYNDLEKELIKVLDKKKIKYYSCVKELNIDNNKLYFLQTKEYDNENENDNSNVIYTELNGYKFMFMGDASIITEKEIMNKYTIPEIDVLKVGHHGSKTSSSKEFIDKINPKYSIISVGNNNRYGHPNKESLNTLKKSKIYRTDQDGSIMFKIKNNKIKIETCSP